MTSEPAASLLAEPKPFCFKARGIGRKMTQDLHFRARKLTTATAPAVVLRENTRNVALDYFLRAKVVGPTAQLYLARGFTRWLDALADAYVFSNSELERISF